jgi:threonine/homoserine/homoserine lactone efflux protein
MQELLSLGAILGALAVGVISPGPSFVMVAKEAVSVSRANGLAAALGMGLGGTAFALAALGGLQAVLVAIPVLYSTLKVLGGLYLCYLGYRIYAGASRPLSTADDRCGSAARSIRTSLWIGLTTQLSNPKTAIVYASVFAAFLPGHLSTHLAVTLVAVVFVLETSWYAIVATLLSAAAPRRAYVGCKSFVDRAAGIVMLGLGLKLIASAHRANAA